MNLISKSNKNDKVKNDININFNDFIKYLESHCLLIIFTIIILILCHGYLLFNNNVGIDTIKFVDEPTSNYNWLENGRYGLLIEKSILNLNSFSMFYVEILSMIFLILFCLVSYYTFYKISGKDFNILNLVLPIICFSSPIFAEQFIFTLQTAEICFSLFLSILSILFIYKWIIEKKFAFGILNVILALICFGTYQSFFVVYISLCLFTFILLYENKDFDENKKLENIWISILKLLGTFIVSFSIYQIIIKLLNCDFNYLNMSNSWKTSSVDTCIKNIIQNIKELVLGVGRYYNLGLPISLLSMVIIGVYNSIKNKKISNIINKIIYFLVYILFALSPILMTVYLAQASAMRGQFFIPLIEALAILFVSYYLCKNKYLKYIAFFSIIIIFLNQAYTLETLYYSDYLTRQNDKAIAHQLIYDLSKAGIKEGDTIYFYGHLEEKINKTTINGEIIGTSMFEFGYSSEPLYYFSTENIIKFLGAMGYNYNIIPLESVNEARINAGFITSNWPSNDCIKKFDDYYIVRLSDI